MTSQVALRAKWLAITRAESLGTTYRADKPGQLVYKKIKTCTAGHVSLSCIDSMPAQGKQREKQKAKVNRGVMGSIKTAAQRQAATLQSTMNKRAKNRHVEEEAAEVDELEGEEEGTEEEGDDDEAEEEDAEEEETEKEARIKVVERQPEPKKRDTVVVFKKKMVLHLTLCSEFN